MARTSRSLAFVLSFLLGCGAADSAGPAPTPSPPSAPAAPFRLEGSVTFDARLPTSTGASSAVQTRPAVGVTVEAHGASGALLASTFTDGEGHYLLEGAGDVTRIEVTAAARIEGDRTLAVAPDELGSHPHAQGFQVPPLTERASWDGHLHAGADDALGGALHILDVLERGYATVERWSGQRLPPLYVYWGPDVTVDWSYYRGERGGRFCLELLAGRRSERTTTDTDEHDEAIVLHELGHFVFDRFTGDSSIGGRHPRGSLVDPGVAWEEGRATWLATAILRDPAYIDSRGIEGTGSARVDEIVESPQLPRGPGSETSVAGILWDLSDGPDGEDDVSPDADGDGLTIGAAAVLRGMISAAQVPGSYVALATFLNHLTSSGAVSDVELRAMLRRSGESEAVMDTPWPVPLALGATATGVVDGITQPAPSGGENRADNGYDAVRAFEVHVESAGTLNVTLTPAGTGSTLDQTDLTLEVRSDRAVMLGTSAHPGGGELVSLRVAPGFYVLYARDAGTGNRAGFTIGAALTP